MKWTLGILILLSLSLNIYLIYEDVQYTNGREFADAMNRSMGLEVNKTKWSQGLKMFQKKLSENHKALLKKKYYYINIWTNWCQPCIREMPWLDSIAGGLKKDVAYIFLTDIHEGLANEVIRKKNYRLRNFVFLNDMNDFVSGLCNERKTKSKIYPMVLIMNNKGEVVYYSIGAYANKSDASGFAELINKLD